MKLYLLEWEQTVPVSVSQAWDFFVNPYNLAVITPDYMGFYIQDKSIGQKIYPGMIIEYRVSPIAKIPMKWVTEITHVQEGNFFVDEQRMGPYLFWHHKHFFEKQGKNTLIRDKVHYALPLDPFSRPIHFLIVRKKLESIFAYRKEKVDSLFQ